MVAQGVRRGEVYDLAAPGRNEPPDGMEQEGPGRDRFHVAVGLCETREDVPPVIDQRYQPGDDAATAQVAGHEAGPAPLVLDLVEHVLAVPAVPIRLSQGEGRQCCVIGHQHHVVPLWGVAECPRELELGCGGRSWIRLCLLCGTPQEDASPGVSPSAQRQRAF